MKLDAFFSLSSEFEKHGFHLWMTGGSARDYLLGRNFQEFDCATDALPSQMLTFLFDANDRFAHYGHISLHHFDAKFDITTLRTEGNYEDARHPGQLTFVRDPKQDVMRRDFTMNALYIDHTLHVLDFVDGLKDLSNKSIQMIGEPNQRLQEDPLRIIRAIRFKVMLGFSYKPSLLQAMKDNLGFLQRLNEQKVIQEVKKIPFIDRVIGREELYAFGLMRLGDML
jgi:tRNA nucleotidyltransferase (CCA-adding enzyme)